MEEKAETQGVSPKLVAAVISAVVAYLLTQSVLELPALVVLALQVVAIVVAVAFAGPGTVRYVGRDLERERVGEHKVRGVRGQVGAGEVELAIKALIFIIVLIIVVWILKDLIDEEDARGAVVALL